MRANRLEQIEDRQSDFPLQFLDEGMAQETRQDHGLHPGGGESPHHIVEIQFLARWIESHFRNRALVGIGLPINDEFGLDRAGQRLNRLDQPGKKIGNSGCVQTANDAVARPTGIRLGKAANGLILRLPLRAAFGATGIHLQKSIQR